MNWQPIKLLSRIWLPFIAASFQLVFSIPAQAEIANDRGYDIPRAPRTETDLDYVHLDVRLTRFTKHDPLVRPMILLDITNTSSNAVCLPMESIPSTMGMENDIISIWNTDSDTLLSFKGLERIADQNLDQVKILPPGKEARSIYGLYMRYDLKVGETYRLEYDVEAFYCDAYERGLPYADYLYKYEIQEASGASHFERSPRTTVKMKAELTFTLE